MSRSRISLVVTLIALASCGDGGGLPVTTTAPSTTVAVTTTAIAPTTTAPPTTTTVPASTSTLAVIYPKAALDYFVEIAFGPEFGGGPPEIRKWNQDVRIVVHGDPNEDDLATLQDVIDDLNGLIATIEVSVVEEDGNVDLYFAPQDQFDALEPNYVPGNMGFFWVWWDGSGNITNTRVLVSTKGLTQEERNHIIREEITQQMGLMSDSYSHEDSIFQQAWTTTQKYSALDELVIELLYLPAVEVGMNVAEVLATLDG